MKTSEFMAMFIMYHFEENDSLDKGTFMSVLKTHKEMLKNEKSKD